MKHKPVYHFRPDKHWINDPNGPIYFQGQYHLFYQYNPTGPKWGNLHWGHAVSQDMIHWTHLPIALSPATDRGEHYCFSGCAFPHNNSIELFYTSIGKLGFGNRGHCVGAEQWIATTDDMITWKQIPDNPVLSTEQEQREGRFQTHWRDPFVFEYKGETLLLLGGNLDGCNGAVHIYRSVDKRHWEYMNVFYSKHSDDVLECPNIAVWEDRVLLIYTTLHEHVHYVVGTINDDYSLNVTRHGGIVDQGCFYATNLFIDHTGRRLLWSWLSEADRGDMLTDGEWCGAISLPREVSLSSEGELMMRPAKEVDLLRGKCEQFVMNGFQGQHVFDFQGDAYELEAELTSDADVVFRVLQARDASEYTEIAVYPRSKHVFFRRGHSSKIRTIDENVEQGGVKKTDIRGTFNGQDGPLKIRLFVDRSIIEVFINDQYAYTTRVYPLNTDGMVAVICPERLVSGKLHLYEITKP